MRTRIGLFVGLTMVTGMLFVPGLQAQETETEIETAAPQVTPGPDELERRVDRLAEQGQLEEARELVAQALEDYPDHEGLQASAAMIQFLLALKTASDELPTNAAAAGVSDAAANRQSALVSEADTVERRVDRLILQGRLDEAQKLLDPALARYPDHQGLQASQGFISFRRNVSRWGVRFGWILLGVCAVFVVCIVSFIPRRPLIAAGTYIFAVYVLFLPIALVIAIAGGGISEMAEAGQFPMFFQHVAMLILSCFLGAIGGAINCSVILANRESHYVPHVGVFSFFFFKPLNGFYLAGAMYFALLAGQIAIFEEAAGMPTPWAAGLLATLTGLFSDHAIEKLRQVSSTLFGSGAARPSQDGKERARPLTTITEDEPVTGSGEELAKVA